MPINNGNPQLENGYTRIANELQVALAKAMAQGIITGKERAIVDWIIRYTYGFHEKNGYFKSAFIAEKLGLLQTSVLHIIKHLVEEKVLIKVEDEIGINKHYNKWIKIAKDSKLLRTARKVAEDSNLEPQPEQLETERKELPKDISLNIDNSTISIKENSLDTPKQKEADSQTVAKVKGSEMQELIKSFCQEMGYEYNSISIKLNVKPAKELLQTYAIDEIIEAIKYGKQKYEKENRDSKTFITNLQAVLNSIIRWRSGIKKEIETQEKNRKSGYLI